MPTTNVQWSVSVLGDVLLEFDLDRLCGDLMAWNLSDAHVAKDWMRYRLSGSWNIIQDVLAMAACSLSLASSASVLNIATVSMGTLSGLDYGACLFLF
jgi:hypothetical protein